MRIIEVELLADESVRVDQPTIYMGEHQAAELRVALPVRLCTGFDYYILHFDLMDSGRHVCTANIYPGQAPAESEEGSASAWLADGVLHCVLPRALTAGSWLRCQVSACVQGEDACVRIDKSAPFIIAFEGESHGDGAEQLTPYTAGEVERVLNELAGIKENLSVDWEAMSAALTALMQESMAGAMAGCAVGTLTVQSNGQLLQVTPGTLWHLEFAPGVNAAELVLDDSGADGTYTPEFRLRVAPPSAGEPALDLHYVGGEAVQLPDFFRFCAGRCYEFNILDRKALAASWEVAA